MKGEKKHFHSWRFSLGEKETFHAVLLLLVTRIASSKRLQASDLGGVRGFNVSRFFSPDTEGWRGESTWEE